MKRVSHYRRVSGVTINMFLEKEGLYHTEKSPCPDEYGISKVTENSGPY